MIVFGGVTPSGYTNTVLAFQPSANAWSRPTITGSTPSPRDNHAAAWDSVNGRMLMFSGFTGGAPPDLWSYSPTGTPLPQRAVIYIQGVRSFSHCNGDGFMKSAPLWLNNYLSSNQSIQSSINVAKFAYFSYSGRPDNYCNGIPGENDGVPFYSIGDTCDSINVYATRLEGLIRAVADKNPGIQVTLIGHSQGGLIASYTVALLQLSDPDFVRQRIASVVLFDSFPGGLPEWALPLAQHEFSDACQLGSANYAAWDDKSTFARTASTAALATNSYAVKFYTISAKKWFAVGWFPGSFTQIQGQQGLPLEVNDQDHTDIWGIGSEPKKNFVGCAILGLANCSANPLPTTFTLTVSRAGSGSGTVNGPGMTCVTTCQPQFISGTVVTLTAVPDRGANASTFSGWGGPCSGTGSCQVTMDASKTVTATFQRVNAGVQVGPVAGSLPNGDRILGATLTARTGCGPIQHIHFGTVGSTFDNARISITSPAGGPSGQTVGFLYAPPAGTTSISITIERVVQSGGATVQGIQLHDGCGEWRTFVGGGARVFQ